MTFDEWWVGLLGFPPAVPTPAPVPAPPPVRRFDHDHCPLGCSHPQAFDMNGKRYCGRCSAIDGVLTEVEPCTEERCA